MIESNVFPDLPKQTHLPSNLLVNRFTGPLKKLIQGLDAAGAAIIMFACNRSRWTTYSRNKQHYSIPFRYRSHLYTYRRVIGQIDLLEQLGLIRHNKRAKGLQSMGLQSSFVPCQELRDMVRKIQRNEPVPTFPIKEAIWLKTGPPKKQKLTDYQSSRRTNRMRREVDEVNAMLQAADIQGCEVPFMVRIFTHDFDHHGRLYAIGNSWQNMHSKDRPLIRIDGESVVEDDYDQIHADMLYELAGLPVPAECFDIEGWPRSLVKRAFYILVNANTFGGAIGAIENSETMASYLSDELASSNWVDIVDPRNVAFELVRAIKNKHKEVEGRFHSGAGLMLMNHDSNLAMDVISLLMDQGIVVLPVYDSFLVKKSHAKELRKAMIQAARNRGFFTLSATSKNDP